MSAAPAMANLVLTVTRGPLPGQVTLAWSAGLAPFSVYRSTAPGGLVSPGNQIATTPVSPWTDTAAVAPLLFYDVEASPCLTNADCADETLCNGTETCVLGVCQPGAPPDCNDGIACTSDGCDPATGCTHTPDDALCPCGQTCDATLGCGNHCVVRDCGGAVYACGDCLDNDGDCRVDADDDECLGPCDNTEDSLYPNLVGLPSPCVTDCYFDPNFGSGDDGCSWSHKCDPLEVAPDFPPEGSACAYDPSTTVGGRTCTQMSTSQTAACTDFCGALAPNGCDCFGCCSIPGAPTTVWLGSVDAFGAGTCTLEVLGDPSLCKPCTQVPSCQNACDHCELCVGKTTLPVDCPTQTCPVGAEPCGLPGQAGCPSGTYCVTGCCQPTP